jgi:ribonuclease HI
LKYKLKLKIKGELKMKTFTEELISTTCENKNKKETVNQFTIYTDGSCLGNPGPGGWAFKCVETSQTEIGGEKETTNNRMEATAILRAMEYARMSFIREIKIFSDSSLMVNQINGQWKIKKNKDIMGKIMSLKKDFDKVEMVWVKAHNGNEFNEEVDQLANNAAKQYANI